jgi:phosphatidylinositol 4-kinase B
MDSIASNRSAVEGKRTVESERETISRWFYNQRDPHRRETALEKLTNSIGHRLIRMPGKLNNSMRTSIEKLKNTNRELQDLLTIKVPETFSMDDEEVEYGHIPSHLHTHEPMPVTDIERGEEKADRGSKPIAVESRSYNSLPLQRPPRIIGPSSPRTSRSSASGAMGQWTSPAGRGNADEVVVNSSDVPIDELIAPTLKRRSYQSVGSRTSNKGSLRVRNGRASVSSMTSDVDTDIDDEEKDGNGHKTNEAHGTPSKPPTKPPPVIFKESWVEKEDRLRAKSAIGDLPGWRLLPVLVKSNDDLRQEQLASQLIYRIALILARERIPVWVCPYEILALESHGGIIEAIPDTISIASLKKNDPNFTDLKGFFDHFFDNPDDLADAKANFCESLAAYSIVCFLLQIKDRHNGNILLDNRGHLIHIDFGFFFLSSPGKNTGFESAPFKLTREWVDLLGGVDSHLFAVFRSLCYRSFIALRKHCNEIILLVEMLKLGNEDLKCFRGRPDDAINELRQRFRLDLNDRACFEYVNSLVDTSLENWRTDWYDRYQRYCVGVL